ncbi:hypothetical protein NX059_001948 [Plenodomus lindquistii]|nr:hypothetical protein NX059_001948 [Plenodomus lindquistii]
MMWAAAVDVVSNAVLLFNLPILSIVGTEVFDDNNDCSLLHLTLNNFFPGLSFAASLYHLLWATREDSLSILCYRNQHLFMGLAVTFRSRYVRITGLVVVFCILATLLVSQSQSTASHSQWLQRPPLPELTPSPPHDEDAHCILFPDPGKIAIAVKTGATEAVEKIPLLMRTTLRCARNVMIFSDLEQEIAGHHIHDALADIPRAAMEGNSDFDFYWKLKEAKKYGQIEQMLRDAHDPRITTDLAAWTLDKYKQLHILEKLYAAYPDKDWYLMIDADSYVVWPNLLGWLQRLPDASSTRMYLGSPAQVGDVAFAHGGSGILLSQATMYDFAVTNKGLAASWDKPMHDECCGDYVIGAVLKKNGILLKPSWPTINGEKPATLPFGPTHWCQPVVTMHHVQPNEMNYLSNFELSRNNTHEPLTFADLYNRFVKDVLPDTLEEWDNESNDASVPANTYEECKKVCEDNKECFQFTHHGGDCDLGHSIHLGGPKKTNDGPAYRSGWLTGRINDWVTRQAPCKPKFPWVR